MITIISWSFRGQIVIKGWWVESTYTSNFKTWHHVDDNQEANHKIQKYSTEYLLSHEMYQHATLWSDPEKAVWECLYSVFLLLYQRVGRLSM